MKKALLLSGGVRPWFARRLRLALVLLAGASACAAAASLHWFLELFSHFTPHYAAVSLLLAGAFLLLRAPRWCIAAAAVAAANILLVAVHFVPPKVADRAVAGTRLGILHFNVGFAHAAPRRVVDYILAEAQRFDVVVLIEASPQWASELKRLGSVYVHSALALEETPWGIAVFSKVTPVSNEIVEASDGVRHSETRLAIPGRAKVVTIYGFHPPPPVSAEVARARNDKLDQLAHTVRGRGDETAVVVGDFNLTPYSPYFRALAETGALKPVRSGVWAHGTWPAMVASIHLGIPLDHVFVSADVDVAEHVIGPNLGSDHLPVGVVLALR